MTDLDVIEARAKAATPGPWEVDDDQQASYPVVRRETGLVVAGCPTGDVGRRPGLPNAVHIAGLDPPTVLALVTELRAAREVVGRTRWLVEHHAAIGDCTCRDALVGELAAYDQAVTP